MYWREYRTEFHIGLAYGISESAVCRTIKKIENALIKSEQFHLPNKKVLQSDSNDFQLFRESEIKLPPHVVLLADAGYQGVAEIHPNSQTPFKKTKLHPLNKEQKTSNRALSRKRIVIEHIFRKLKVFRILRERYRNRKKRFGLRFSLIAAVYNMELTIACG